MDVQPGKRTRTGTRNEIGQKRRRLETRVSNFLDIEAGEGSSEGQGSDNEYFIDGNIDAIGDGGFEGDEEEDEDPSESMLSVNRQKNYSRDEHNDEDQNQSESVQSVKRQGYSRDDRLSAVINRYEARAAAADDAIESDIENEGEIEEIALLAERALRMPNEHDPGIWRVRVLDGAAEESFFLLQDRLKARPRWAFSTFLPPGSRQWIYVESASRDYVKNLCKNLSTFPHPLQIFFVPVEEHLESLNGSRMMPSINPGSWVRLKRRSELEGLVPNLDERLIKYANDLGYVQYFTLPPQSD
ncbi:hypothetical protein F5887DRAFT_1085354 [Amanita rubescens]|nr:hypothetical protein F5887DRAFT_1085354 [Amanita rubescens]